MAALSHPLGVFSTHITTTKAGGAPVEAVELSNSSGVSARIITLGAAVQSLATPDRRGDTADIALGYARAQQYLDQPHYFGATVGRFANRIAAGRFSLDGKAYHLAANDSGNCLHGGHCGFDKAIWRIDSTQQNPAGVTLSYLSPAGEEGYPGNLQVRAVYALNERNELSVHYRATTDAPTIVSLTNHGYFNLAGESSGRSAMSHLLQINAARYTPVDQQLVPTGELRPVAGTAFDFRQPAAIGLRIRDGGEPQILLGRGYDHNFALDGAAGRLRAAARVADPVSGRVLDIATTAPGIQFYSGNLLNGSVVGKSGLAYRQGDGIALEPQAFPDSPNRPEFPSARLDPGDTYENAIVYRFSAEQR
jgi:aldose 1-epimerase